jgi:hypothetical protein
MPKEFYTERDIEDLWKHGTTSLQLGEDVVLTDLAYEKAQRLGLNLLKPPKPTQTGQMGLPVTPPAAPVRPYLSDALPSSGSVKASTDGDLAKRIHEAVSAKLGDQVDPQLLDSIIQRVLKSTGVK